MLQTKAGLQFSDWACVSRAKKEVDNGYGRCSIVLQLFVG
jgi:hypothetical protein